MPPIPLHRPLPRMLRCAITALALATAAWAPAHAQAALPPEVSAALARARLPADSVVAWVADAEGRQPPRVAWRAQVPVNPASVMKLVTTYAALDLLGPAYSWPTQVFVEGAVREGTLYGNLHIRGQGDPKLVSERLWLLLRRVQGIGIRSITGDIVLDRTAFELPPHDAAAFDGDPTRPYNAAADALLVNYRSIVMTFTPERTSGVATIQYEPPLAGVQLPATVPLGLEPCADWRSTLGADFSDPARVRFTGVYPATCGERAWPVAPMDPDGFSARAIEGLWREAGGQLRGTVRQGQVPAGLKPAFEVASPALAEVVRDVNKFSNNVMAQQLFLTLSLAQRGRGTPDASREVIRQWWASRIGPAEAPPVIDNGSGLSRASRISAQGMGR
ncbi:MAG: D-alanyl-D-alanine carboxypeptidase/D-alanyl-D-alanine-endopeptidase, partial [Burkholderiaceae bacterium]|nr:D-alanyl-D-alanine carboxypeptidase/D-alanyl-D-alanine-endopeptidase [Burkholderiaceae bacterium]